MTGLNRRRAIGAIMFSAACVTVGMSGQAMGKPIADEIFYIGMRGPQIHAARFDPVDGDMTLIGPVADNPRPTWAVRHPRKPIIYFNEETGGDGKSDGGVYALQIDKTNGALTKISDVRAGGAGTTHLWFDRPSMTILAANYGSGSVAAIPVHADGTLGPPVSVVKFSGSGPHRRQASPHAHGVTVDPSGKFALVADLGSDRVFVLPFDRKTRRLGDVAASSSRHYVASAGSGPRHMAFHPNGKTLYVVNELTAEVEALGWNAREGRLTQIQKVSTSPADYTGNKSVAEIAVSSDGRFVYVSSRGDHMIVAFEIDKKTRKLKEIQRIPSEGTLPWHFALHRSGKWMLVTNRDSDSINLFAINRRTGKLSNTGKSLTTPKPVHIAF